MVQAFDYVMVLAAVIAGLALTHMLVGITRMIEARREQKLFWVHLVWFAAIFLTVLLWWWAEFRLSRGTSWTFGLYLFVIAYAVLLFLMSAALVPSALESVVDYRAFFETRKKWFMSLIIAYAIIDLPDTALKGTAYLRELGWPYFLSDAACIVLPLAAMRIRSVGFQGAIAIAFLADQLFLAFRNISAIS